VRIVFNMFAKLVLFAVAIAGVSFGVGMLDSKTSNKDQTAQTQSGRFASTTRTQRTKVTAISADRNGQFTASALVNGVHVEMLADTGATLVVLTAEDAERIGIDLAWLNFDTPVQTANGVAMTAKTILDEVSVGGIPVRDVDAIVTRAGLLTHSLLGMSYLGALHRFEIKGDQLVLHH